MMQEKEGGCEEFTNIAFHNRLMCNTLGPVIIRYTIQHLDYCSYLSHIVLPNMEYAEPGNVDA